MRLLNTSTYGLESFLGTEKPRYAILSHTWEPEGELLFNDLHLPPKQFSLKPGFPKIKNTCTRAVRDGFKYAWIDTVCIDKSSSAELSEAINSMFRWYKESAVCYAYLADVELKSSQSYLRKSLWFTRGWTLQELIAPNRVLFYDMNWRCLGSRRHLASVITSATQIPKHVLDRPRQTVEDVLQSASVAQRMNWASKRVTTREEDIAYCLMGIFDVNMPLLYGEGQKAFFRLQEAILSASKDQSILAFRHPDPQTKMEIRYHGFSPVLAPDPTYFCDDIRRGGPGSYVPAQVRLEYGNVTLDVTLVPFNRASGPITTANSPTHIALLDCMCGNDYLSRPGLLLQAVDKQHTHFKRCTSKAILVKSTMATRWLMHIIGSENITNSFECNPDNWREAQRKSITIENNRSDTTRSSGSDIHQPSVLGYAGILDHCLLEYAIPKASSEYHEIVLQDSVGLALFTHRGVELFIAWGYDTKPWCSIHRFQDLRSTWNFRNKLPGLKHGFGAEALMEELEHTQLPELDLIEMFKKAPFIWSQPFTMRFTSRITKAEKSLAIMGHWSDKEYVGRKYRYVEIISMEI